MKTTIREIASLLLFVAAPLGFAQRGGIGQIGYPNGRSSDPTLNATADQHVAIAKCLEATDLARQTANKIPRIGSFWSRSRRNYSNRDLSALSDLSGQLQAALANLAATHKEFLEELTDRQATEFKRQLKKLDQLGAKMNSDTARLNRDLAAAKPGPFSPNISWDIDSIERAVGKWRSVHRKIANELGIPQ